MSELLALAKDADRPCSKRSKQQLIDSLCDEATSTARTGSAGCDGKIRLLYASVGFRPLKDDDLISSHLLASIRIFMAPCVIQVN